MNLSRSDPEVIEERGFGKGQTGEIDLRWKNGVGNAFGQDKL